MTPEETRRKRHRNQRIAAATLVLMAATATGWVTWTSARLERESKSLTTYVPKPFRQTAELTLLQEYLRIDTSNPPGNEIHGARWLAGKLAEAGVKSEIIESEPGRASLYARIGGKNPEGGLLLLHHIDVYPADPAGWKEPPFAAKIRLNEVVGRGALDMKGIGICHLVAFLDLARSGRSPEHDVVFLAVADEEAGGKKGMSWLLEHRADVVAGVRYAINEGGITEIEGERLLYYGVEIGTKQRVSLLLAAKKREQLQAARRALEPWFTSREPDRILPEVRQFFRELAPRRMAFRRDLEDVDASVAEGRFWHLPIGYREMTQNGVWAEGIRPAGSGFEMPARLFNLPDQDPDARIEWLRRQVEPYDVTIKAILAKDGPVPLSSADTPFFALIRRQVHREYGAEVAVGTEILNRSFNDSRYLRVRGIHAYGVNPFPVDFFQSEAIHGQDERVRADLFQQGIGFTRDLVRAFARTE